MRAAFRTLLFLSVVASAPLILGCGGGSGSSGQTGRVAGRVFQQVGRASRAPVTIAIDGTTISTVAGPDGRFTLNGVPVGLHTVFAKSDTGAIAVVAEVTGGAETNLGDLQLGDSGQISGLVTTVANGVTKPVALALVTVTQVVPNQPSATATPGPVRVTHTNGQGSYTIDGLPVGDYLVNVSAQGYQTASLVATVAAGHTTTGDLTLTAAATPATGAIAGTVSLLLDDGTKEPLSGALVRVARFDDPRMMNPMPASAGTVGGSPVTLAPGIVGPMPPVEYYTFTDEQGQYKLSGVPAGDYTAVAVRPGLEPDSKPVTITAGSTLTQDFTCVLRKPTTGIVTGTVTDSAGNAISGAQVNIHFMAPLPYAIALNGGQGTVSATAGGGAAGSPIFITPIDLVLSATTGPDGTYKLVAPAGPQLVTAYADGFLAKQVQVTVPPGSQVTANITLDKDPGVLTVSGKTVTKDSTGAIVPVPNAQVYASFYIGPGIMAPGALGAMPTMVFSATSDAQGAFAISLRTGPYYFSAQTDTLYAPPLKVDVSSTMQPVQLMLVPAPTPPPPTGR